MKTEKIVFGISQPHLKIGDISLACYVLQNKDYLLKKSDLQKALHYDGKAEDWILDILAVISKFTPVSHSLIDAYENPIIGESTFNNKTSYVKGVTVEVFIETCKIISDAKSEGYLNLKHLKYARAAQNILKHLEDQDLYHFIDVSIGFVFFKESVKDKIRDFLFSHTNETAFLWVPTFQDSVFDALMQMNNMYLVDFQKDTRIASKVVFECVFDRMPRELLALLRAEKPKRIYQKAGKKSQKNQHTELQVYLLDILSLAKAAANNRNIFLRLLNKAYPKNILFENQDFSFFEKAGKISPSLSPFDLTLKKSLASNKTYSIKKRGH